MLLSKYIKNSKEISKLNSKTGVKETPPQRRYFFVVVVILLHLLSHVQLFVTPWTAAYQCPLSSTVSWSLLTFMSIESMMVSNHLMLCHPLLLLSSVFSSIRFFSSESTLHSRWPKYWSFSFSISLSREYSGFISFKID